LAPTAPGGCLTALGERTADARDGTDLSPGDGQARFIERCAGLAAGVAGLAGTRKGAPQRHCVGREV